jgi:hypothetical protein
MRWRVLIELTGADGSVRLDEVVSGGGRPVDPLADSPVGLTLVEGKTILGVAQARLVEAQAAAYCAARRQCGHCGGSRALKGWRRRRLVTLFGTIDLRAPVFKPCRCGVACRRYLSPLSEIMPDPCTPEFERMMARMGSLVAYGRVPALMAEFLPVGRSVTPETVRRRTLRVGARLETPEPDGRASAAPGAGSGDDPLRRRRLREIDSKLRLTTWIIGAMFRRQCDPRALPRNACGAHCRR